MNVEDIQIDYSEYVGRDLMKVVFNKQQHLMDCYGIPSLDLDIPRDQQLIRSMAWSVVEEAGEAMQVYQGSKHHAHIGDELADMMHFYIELLIMSGLTPEDIYAQLNLEQYKQRSLDPFGLDDMVHLDTMFRLQSGLYKHDAVDFHFKEFIIKLSLAINVLKNRVWRETNLKTDQTYYKHSLRQTFFHFFHFCNALGFTPLELVDFYLRKNEVNLFRIRSKY